MIQEIRQGDQLLAMIVPRDFAQPGVSFFTPDHFSQQLAYMQHPAGKTIVAHTHRDVHRALTKTLEVLFIRRGRLRVDLYDDAQNYVESRVIGAGDVLLLVSGGHGFETLEPVEMFEVKQGPFAGAEDKVRIDAVAPERVRIVGGER
jgi:uncharacterized protein with PhoU and TrkA domain